MNTAELEEKKRLIIQEIQQIEDERILKAIEELLDLEEEIDIEEYNNDINTSMEQFRTGKYLTQEELERESKTW